MQSKFSKVFYDIESAINFCYFNDLVRIVEYRDDFHNYYNQKRAHRVGLRIGDNVEWGPWRGTYHGFENVRSVYRADLNSKIDNAFEGIV